MISNTFHNLQTPQFPKGTWLHGCFDNLNNQTNLPLEIQSLIGAYLNTNNLFDLKTKKLAFLGTMAGTQIFPTNATATYTRKYSRFGGSDQVREKLFAAMHRHLNGKGISLIGNHYSFTPAHLRKGQNFGSLPSNWQGGGFFLLVKKLKSTFQHSSLEYVIHTLGHDLQAISGFSAKELCRQVNAYGVNYLIHHYFTCIKTPEEGDLIVYTDVKYSQPQCGIYKNSKPNWNSSEGGTVESKWDWHSNPYVFQHDLFFTPPYFGNVAKFYRIKSTPIRVDTLAMRAPPKDHPRHPLASNQKFTVQEDGSLNFNSSNQNKYWRQLISDTYPQDLPKQFPGIKCLSHINFFGLCYHYAFQRILSSHATGAVGVKIEAYGNIILNDNFISTCTPQKGDLVVYFSSTRSNILHWGIYLDNEMVESKWGSQSVFRHHFFDIPIQYGNRVRCYRLKDGITKEDLEKYLKAL